MSRMCSAMLYFIIGCCIGWVAYDISQILSH